MWVTRNMLHKELQNGYGMMKVMGALRIRRFGVRLLNSGCGGLKASHINGLHCEERFIPGSNNGERIRIRIFRPSGQDGALPGMLYIRGEELMLCNSDDCLDIIKRYIETKACIVIVPCYRKLFNAPFPAAFHDCYDTLLWINAHTRELCIIPEKLIVAGHGSGAGIVVAVTLKARDTKDVKIAFQVPVYPMLDDRQDTVSARDNNAPGCNAKYNKLGWDAYLRTVRELHMEVPSYAAPARAENLRGLPPAITFVGGLEPFRDETLEYVGNLKKEGIAVTFRMFEGCYHAFEVLRPDLPISKEAWNFLLTAFSQYVDKYCLDD